MSNNSKRINKKNNTEGEFKDPFTFHNMHGDSKAFNQEEAKVIMLNNDQIPAATIAEPKPTRNRSNKSNKSTTVPTEQSSKNSGGSFSRHEGLGDWVVHAICERKISGYSSGTQTLPAPSAHPCHGASSFPCQP